MEDIKQTFYDKLEEYSKLKKDWISGGKPIHKDIIETSKMIIDRMENLEHWNIAPFINGSILMDYRYAENHGCINIAQKGVSCYVVDNNYKTFQKNFGKNKEKVINELIDFINLSWQQ